MQRAAQTYGAVAKQTANPRELEADLLLTAAARLQAIHDFQCVTAGLNEIRHQLAPLGAGEVVLPRVRQADPGTRGAQGSHRIGQGWPVLLHIAQLAGP